MLPVVVGESRIYFTLHWRLVWSFMYQSQFHFCFEHWSIEIKVFHSVTESINVCFHTIMPWSYFQFRSYFAVNIDAKVTTFISETIASFWDNLFNQICCSPANTCVCISVCKPCGHRVLCMCFSFVEYFMVN